MLTPLKPDSNTAAVAWSVGSVLLIVVAAFLLLGSVYLAAAGDLDAAAVCALVAGAGLIWAYVIDAVPDAAATAGEDDDDWF